MSERTSPQNLVAKRYLGKFGYLASISAAHSNKNFKAKRIHDELMFAAEEMEVKWTEKQRQAMNQKLAENFKKRAGMDNYHTKFCFKDARKH